LFLDEIAELDVAMQAKLLRALQERKIRRVGGTHELNVDVRVIAATNRDLRAMVADGRFRDDLYYRINVLSVDVPPLRERREDIPLLIEHFLKRFARERSVEVPDLSPAVRAAFSRYRWPGNVRELENACERIVQICSCGTARVGCLSPAILLGTSREMAAAPVEAPVPPSVRPICLDERLREVESNLIAWALKVTDGNKSRAAELLNIKRSTLGDRIVRCGLAEPGEDAVH
jgi:transcriptional regulator with PAS, ATPase and Fis domain